MGRAKLKLELIPKEKARNLTYKKRKEGIMKKMREFTTLCDVNACMIIYGPNSHASEPAIWPEDRSEVERMINLYRERSSDSSARTYGLSNFFSDRKKKLEEDVKKLRQRNLEAKYPTPVDFFDRLSKTELENFIIYLNTKLEASVSRLEMIEGIDKEREHNNNSHSKSQTGQSQTGQLTNYNNYQVMYDDPNGSVTNSMFDYSPHWDSLGFSTPLSQYRLNPNTNLMFDNTSEYMHNNLQVGYRQLNYFEQFYIDRTTMQEAVAPPLYGGDLPPLPPCYLEVNEVKSTCTLPVPALPSYYLEEKESHAGAIVPVAGGGGGAPPQMAAGYSYLEHQI